MKDGTREKNEETIDVRMKKHRREYTNEKPSKKQEASC